MMPLQLLTPELVQRVLDEAFRLLETRGVRVQSPAGLELLAQAGAQVEANSQHARIPEGLVRRALETAPRSFSLYDRSGRETVQYGGDAVQFDPGSSAVHILDAATGAHRPAVTDDLVRLVKVAEALPQYAAQSTAVNCSDVPAAIGDMYRLYLVLLFSSKPIVTGAFAIPTLGLMRDMLLAVGGDGVEGRQRAVFDVCPSPPLNWTEFATENLLYLARQALPAELISMPLSGATAPVTLAGSVVQHAAETLSGITLHQLAGPGAPVVWGGAPAVFDMRRGTTPMGAMETAMMDAAYAQVGKSLGLPTHTYLGASDSKTLDAQAGMESGMSALVGALAGINMISGAGMLDFLACQSVEKLVLDAEAIAMVQRLLAGIQARGDTLALEAFASLGSRSDFLGLHHTRQWFKAEQHLPSEVIDRGSVRAWIEAGQPDSATRARRRVDELLAAYRLAPATPEAERDLHGIMSRAASQAGMASLPKIS